MQARISRVADCGVLCIGAGGVVALLANLPARAVPDLLQVLELGGKHRFGVAPDLHFTLADFQRSLLRAGFADEMAEPGQAVFAQGLHHLVAGGGGHLDHHTQLFIEQGLERELITARPNLVCPVFAVARVHAAVGNAITLDHQHVDVQRHAHMAGKGHFAAACQQAAVATVVVGQDLSLGAQRVDGIDEVDQIFRIVQVRHRAVLKIQALRQDGAAHAVLALAQVDEDQRGVRLHRVQLGRERAAHVGERREGADDQGHR